MIVCSCEGVSNHTVREVIDRGAATIRDIGEACGAGTGCAQCHCDLVRMIEDARVQEREPALPWSLVQSTALV